jgi:regulator of cell morphogenesis and NO signaling
MTTIQTTQRIGEIVAEYPQTKAVFEALEIDYYCEGTRRLVDIIPEIKLNEQELLLKLQEAVSKSIGEKNWNEANYKELIDHIENTHHAYLKSELPELSTLVTELLQQHQKDYPELSKIYTLVRNVKRELESHMVKEEKDAFRLIRDYEADPSEAKFKFLVRVIVALESEHDVSEKIMKELRQLTNHFTLPAECPASYLDLVKRLEHLDKDLAIHVHLENNILFVRILKERMVEQS